MRTTPFWTGGQLNQATDLETTITSYPFGEGGISIRWVYGVAVADIYGIYRSWTHYVKRRRLRSCR